MTAVWRCAVWCIAGPVQDMRKLAYRWPVSEPYAGRLALVKPGGDPSAGAADEAPGHPPDHGPAGRRSPGYRPAGTLRNTFRLPNVRGTRPLGCGQRSWARGSGI